jgi:hypothetical protein
MPGRFRRLLIGQPFPKDVNLPGQLREKKSVTGHLPKGNLATWRDAQKRPKQRRLRLFGKHKQVIL